MRYCRHYCLWHAVFTEKKLAMKNKRLATLLLFYNILRYLAPGNMVEEIREDAYKVDLEEFCTALDIPKLDK